MKEVVRFCVKENLVLVADEVYQENIWKPDMEFHSFKKVVCMMGPEADGLELFSFHSVSKGFFGECGRRGGYMEMYNIHPEVKQELYKLSSIDLCSNTDGQVMVSCMVSPPTETDASYEEFQLEKTTILESLRRRAEKLCAVFNGLEGIECNSAEAALYIFPRISLSPLAIEAAKIAQCLPDVFFCKELLRATGICVVPGSGFGQKEGTYHFRTTILPPESDIDDFVDRFSEFYNGFREKYAS